MISSPVYYYRQYAQDLSSPPAYFNRVQKVQNILGAALPLVSFIPSTRTPLSLCLGFLRPITHLQSLVQAIVHKDFSKVSITTLHFLLSALAVAFVITALVNSRFNPSWGLIVTGVDDIIGNIVAIKKSAEIGNKKLIIENITHLISSLLYLSSITFGHIEILATFMLLQVGLHLYKSIDHCTQGNYFEALCHLITSLLTLRQAIPQIKVIQWKWSTKPLLEGILCRDERGFVYVKVEDKVIFELNKIFGDDLPPYFGPGKHGAHITVIPAGELDKNVPIAELGTTIQFTIASFEALKPENFKGVDKVYFLALGAPQLDNIRTKYQLPARIKQHDPHITFGVHYEN